MSRSNDLPKKRGKPKRYLLYRTRKVVKNSLRSSIKDQQCLISRFSSLDSIPSSHVDRAPNKRRRRRFCIPPPNILDPAVTSPVQLFRDWIPNDDSSTCKTPTDHASYILPRSPFLVSDRPVFFSPAPPLFHKKKPVF